MVCKSGTIDTLTLESANPGEIVVSWQAPSPSPIDYRVSWTPDEQDYVSWRDSNEDHRGNSYPGGDATSTTLTGLSEGTEYKVRIRARYRTEQNANNPWSGPWNEETVTVAGQPEPVGTSTPEVTPAPAPEPAGATSTTSTIEPTTPRTADGTAALAVAPSVALGSAMHCGLAQAPPLKCRARPTSANQSPPLMALGPWSRGSMSCGTGRTGSQTE